MKMMSTDNFFGSVSQVHNVASGINSRINNSSTDQSTNIAVAGDVFGNLSAALQAGVSDAEQLATLLAAVEDMKRTRGGGGFAAAYQKFISPSTWRSLHRSSNHYRGCSWRAERARVRIRRLVELGLKAKGK
jgi:hypothetical protein